MSRKPRKKPAAECVYCGTLGEITYDHVPPKNLFPRPRPSNLITVPSCKRCNNSASKDDEYLRNSIVMRSDVGEHEAANMVLSTALSALARPQQRMFNREFTEGISVVWLRSMVSDLIAPALAYTVKMKRLIRVFNRIARGLYYHERKERIPTMCSVVSLMDIDDTDWHIIDSLMSQPYKSIGDGVFSYRPRYAEDSRFAAFWQIVLYDSIRVISLSNPETPVPYDPPLQPQVTVARETLEQGEEAF